jgi:two-component system sensor histidine kinase DegS
LLHETEKLRKLNCFGVQFDITGNPVFMDAQKELFIFRIVQEAFNNILKHAQAATISLHLYYSNDHVDITVIDDGVGFTMPNGQQKLSTHFTAGLRNMQKRAELLNGHCHIKSSPGKGTTINIAIPF